MSDHIRTGLITSDHVRTGQTTSKQVIPQQTSSNHIRQAQTISDHVRTGQNMSEQAWTLQSRSDHIQTSTNLTCSDVVQWCGLTWFDLFWNGPTWHGLTPPPSEIKLRGRVKVCEKYKMNKLPAEPLKVSIQNVLMPSESKIDKNINTLLGKIFEK